MRRLLALALRTVPEAWRPDVATDLAEEYPTAPIRQAAQAIVIGAGLRLKRRRAGRRRFPPSALAMLDDLRFAGRRLRRRPAAGTVSILALALALGASTATWSLISTVFLRPVAVGEIDNLFVVSESQATRTAPEPSPSSSYVDLIRLRGSGLDVAAAGGWPVNVGIDGATQSRSGYFVTANFFSVLRVPLLRGRSFAIDDDRNGASPVAIVSERFWRQHLAGSDEVLTRSLRVEGHIVPIVGVLPRSFRGIDLLTTPDVYFPLHVVEAMVPLAINPLSRPERGSQSRWLWSIARASSQDDLSRALTRVPPASGGDQTTAPWRPVPLREVAFSGQPRAQVAAFARMLAVAIALLVALGAVSVGVLLLGGVEQRRDELAVALALGASRWRLARSVVSEGVILSACGAALALPAALAFFNAARTYQLPGGLEIAPLDLQLEPTTLIVSAVGVVIVTGLISLVAVGAVFSARAAEVVQVRTGGSGRRQGRWARSLTIVAQVAATLVLLAGGGVFLRSLSAALALNAGYDTARVLDAEIGLSRAGYVGARAREFHANLLARLRAMRPHAPTGSFLSKGGMGGQIPVDDQPRKFSGIVSYIDVDEQFFQATGLRVIEGRDFTADDRPGAPLVAIVTASLARELKSNVGRSVGARIGATSGAVGKPRNVYEVVGVVPDFVTSTRVLQPLNIYYPIAQGDPPTRMTVRTRVTGDLSDAMNDIRSAMRELDSEITVPPMLTVQQRLLGQMRPQQLGLFVLGGLGLLALLLTVLGIYVTTDTFARGRRREMAIRSALGATQRDVSRLMLRTALGLVGAGLFVGLVLAWFGSKMIGAFLFRTAAFDLLTLGAVSACLLLVALAAALLPARRASNVNPVDVLRDA